MNRIADGLRDRLLIVIIALGVTQVVGYGTLYYAFAILVPSIAATLEVGEPLLVTLMSTGLLIGGLIAPLLGRTMDRIGAASVMAPASALCAVLLVWLSLATDIYSFAAALLLVELVAPAVLYGAAFATLTQFDGVRARGAITRLTLVGGFASTLFWPLTGALLSVIDWRTIYLLFGALHLGVALPLHLVVARLARTERTSQLNGLRSAPARPKFAPLPQSMHRFGFWAFASSVALSGLLMAGINFHFVPILAATGLGASAYVISMFMGPAQVLARLTDAMFWQGLHPLSVALISAFTLPVSIFVLILEGPAWLGGIAFAVGFGAGQGLSSIVLGTVPLSLFGTLGYAHRLGQISMIRVLLSAAAPAAFALIAATLGIKTALWLMLGVGLAATIPLLVLRRRVLSLAAEPA